MYSSKFYVVFWLMSLSWLRILQVPDGATVALVPRHSKHIHHDNHDYVAGESKYTHKGTFSNLMSNLILIYASVSLELSSK